jgi:hypothetical protein
MGTNLSPCTTSRNPSRGPGLGRGGKDRDAACDVCWGRSPDLVRNGLSYPIIVILISLAFVTNFGLHVGWIPILATCVQHPDCFPAPGETLVSLLGGRRLVTDGHRYWFLQNLQGDGLNSRPQIYTHNSNLASFIYYGFGELGVRDPTIMTIWTAMVAFGLGLFYAWLFVFTMSCSNVFSAIFLLLLATEYHFNLLFGLNALRAWHWAALFGSLFHIDRWVLSDRGWARFHLVLFMIWTFVAFLLGYDFLSVVIFSVVGLLFFVHWLHPMAWGNRGGLKIATLVAAAFIVPVFLRQMQVIAALGANFWARDLYYTAVLKMPVLHKFLRLPPLRDIDFFYRVHDAVRLITTPSPGVRRTLQVGLYFWNEYWIPYIGRLESYLSSGSLLLAVAVVATCILLMNPASSVRAGAFSNGLLARLLRPAATVLIVVAGQVLGLFMFLPFAVFFYVRYAFPLLISSVTLLLAFACYFVIVLAIPRICEKGVIRFVWKAVIGLIVAFIIGNHMERQVVNYWRLNHGHIRFLSAQSSYALRDGIIRKLQTFGLSHER